MMRWAAPITAGAIGTAPAKKELPAGTGPDYGPRPQEAEQLPEVTSISNKSLDAEISDMLVMEYAGVIRDQFQVRRYERELV